MTPIESLCVPLHPRRSTLDDHRRRYYDPPAPSRPVPLHRYDGEDCSAEIELKPDKPLPAITSFFSRSPDLRKHACTDTEGCPNSAVRTEAGGVGGGNNVSRAASSSTANDDEEKCTSTPVNKKRVRGGESVGGGDVGVDRDANESATKRSSNEVDVGRGERDMKLELTSSVAMAHRWGVQGSPLDLSQDDEGVGDASETVPTPSSHSPSLPSGVKHERTDARRAAGTASPTVASSKKKQPSATASPAKRSGKKGTSPVVKDKRQSRLTSFFQQG